MSERAELQVVVDAPRAAVFSLLATTDGLRQWLDAAEVEARVGGSLRVQMLDGQAVGEVLAYDPPTHISFTWRWSSEPVGAPSVVAFDAIEHGGRTLVTLRHVGLPTHAEAELHTEMWRHWLARFEAATRALAHATEET